MQKAAEYLSQRGTKAELTGRGGFKEGLLKSLVKMGIAITFTEAEERGRNNGRMTGM